MKRITTTVEISYLKTLFSNDFLIYIIFHLLELSSLFQMESINEADINTPISAELVDLDFSLSRLLGYPLVGLPGKIEHWVRLGD